MKIFLIIVILVIGSNLQSQELKQLEIEIGNTLENKDVERKAKEIFTLDPFNEIAIFHLTNSYRCSNNESLITIFFDSLALKHPQNVNPYILSALYKYPPDWEFNPNALHDLKKALSIDENHYEANLYSGEIYYQLFNEEVQNNSLEKAKLNASKGNICFLRTIGADSTALSYLKYPIIQLSSFLEDSITLQSIKNLKIVVNKDKEGLPVKNQFYFPVKNYVDFEDSLTLHNIDIFDKLWPIRFSFHWYGRHLKALKEPIIFDNLDKEIFRFTWLRTFHKPIAISIKKNEKDQVSLNWKMTDGMGGYDPGKLIIDETKELTNKEWIDFQNLLSEANYWELPTTEEILGGDGSEWLIEGIQNGKYTIVDRWTPRGTPFQKLGLFLLNLTNLQISEEDKY